MLLALAAGRLRRRGEDARGQARERQALQPHRARPGQAGQEQPLAAEQRGAHLADELDVEVDAGRVAHDAAGVHQQRLPGSQFALLRAQWGWERIAVAPQMAWRWAGYALVMLLGVAALVSVLPTRYSVGLLTALAYVLTWITGVIYALFLLAAWPVAILVSRMLEVLQLDPDLLRPPTDLLPPAPAPTRFTHI